MDFLKELALKLAEDIPSWTRSICIFMIIIFGGLKLIGVSPENIERIVDAIDVVLNNKTILLSARSDKDKNKTVNEAAESLYEKIRDDYGAVGVSIISFEPELQPKLLKVISREGSKTFDRTVEVGSERYLQGGSKDIFITNREGITSLYNLHDNKILMDIGIVSIISMPIMYRQNCVGSVMIFLSKSKSEINPNDYLYVEGSMKIEVNHILNELYFK